ncbi:methyltransferase-like protein 25B isoform X2 [Vespa velutina]|uniref:methyltransferase-like protein 25B isoform X2 n=1 Tax=Vespa velutina TaxID=202808 RepID=UPI001FB2A7B5|nr:methyltransferase-like protein 25B isoform X2 [Vespa velutina]
MATTKDSITECTCNVCRSVRLRIDKIFCVLDIYGWMLDFYVVDFYRAKLWDKLPKSWKFALKDIPPDEFGLWLSRERSCRRILPLSLLALRKVIDNLQLNRNDESSSNFLQCEKSLTIKTKCKNITSLHLLDNEEQLKDLDFASSQFIKLFRKHVKKKKTHEIEQMAQSECKSVVDVGAGLGHLARLLTYQYGLHVACIEQDELLSKKARLYDEELLMSMRKHEPNFSPLKLEHISLKLETSNHAEMNFKQHLHEIFANIYNVNTECLQYGIIGLHPCGDLASILLNLYSLTKEARFMCIVGCCYMKMTLESNNENKQKGYPLSSYFSFKNHKLSYNALEIACHAIEKHCDKLKNNNYADLIVHAYRAVLENILTERNLLPSHSQLKNVKVTRDMTFKQYCFLATRHLQSELQPKDIDLEGTEVEHYLSYWLQIVIFSSLRILLAPLVETLVLLDRFLYLSERNLNPIIRPVFNAKLSPRNLVLISVKNHNEI